MARKQRPDDGARSLRTDQAISLLNTQIRKAQELLEHRPIEEGAVGLWSTSAVDALLKAVGGSSPYVQQFRTENYVGMFAIGGHTPSQQKQEQRRVEHLKKKLLILQAAADSLREQYDLEQMDASQAAASSGQSTSAGTDVFLVHGRNERWLQETARFLEKITITPTILKEEPNRGLTIIEKLMAHSAGVGFAVVLLTADDYGGLLADPQKCQNRRARQNVILELGLFIGRLGRDRVCSLYEKGVELPSDYDGVGFVPLDEAGAWKVALAKELKAAEIPFDAGKLLD